MPDEAPKKTSAIHRHERHHRHGSEAAAYLCVLLDDDKHDDDMTVPEYTSNSSSCKNPIGIGKSTANDAHDGDDDELLGFSKWVHRSLLRRETVRRAGSRGSTSTIKSDADAKSG